MGWRQLGHRLERRNHLSTHFEWKQWEHRGIFDRRALLHCALRQMAHVHSASGQLSSQPTKCTILCLLRKASAFPLSSGSGLAAGGLLAAWFATGALNRTCLPVIVTMEGALAALLLLLAFGRPPQRPKLTPAPPPKTATVSAVVPTASKSMPTLSGGAGRTEPRSTPCGFSARANPRRSESMLIAVSDEEPPEPQHRRVYGIDFIHA